MKTLKRDQFYSYIIFGLVALSLSISTIVLNSIKPALYPQYYAYIAISLLVMIVISRIDFKVLETYSLFLYIFSIFLLVLPLIIGQVTRGVIRWIPLGPISFQPSEIVRPFLLLFFAVYIYKENVTKKRIIKLFFFFVIPFILILIQPSLGVAFLTLVGFIGILLSSSINKKYVFAGLAGMILLAPLFWTLLKPYQKDRLSTFINPYRDPQGAGYNSIQSTITVGSGKIIGKGLGKGGQTQLSFLPEKETDFIYASISEELGFLGSISVIFILFGVLFALISVAEKKQSPISRAFVSSIVFVMFVEIVVHVGMNMGMVPITGVPLPLFSAGGSALLGTLISLAICLGDTNY